MTSAQKTGIIITVVWVLLIVGVAVATRHLIVLGLLGLLALFLLPLRRR
jgi:hypothetical protein